MSNQQPYDPQFPNGYVWVRLKPKDPQRCKVDGIKLLRLFALDQVWQGGDGIAVIPRWYKVSPGIAQKLLYFRQDQDLPNSPYAFDFVTDEATKNTIDISETYNRHARMGLGVVPGMPGTFGIPGVSLGAQQAAPLGSVAEIMRQEAVASRQPQPAFSPLAQAAGQVYMTPGSEQFASVAANNGIPGGMAMYPAVSLPQSPNALPAPQLLPSAPQSSPQITSVQSQAYPPAYPQAAPQAPPGTQVATLLPTRPPQAYAQAAQPIPVQRTFTFEEVQQMLAAQLASQAAQQLQQPLQAQMQAQVAGPVAAPVLQPAFAGRSAALRGVPVRAPDGGVSQTSEKVMLGIAAQVDEALPDSLDVPGGDIHLTEAELMVSPQIIDAGVAAEVAALEAAALEVAAVVPEVPPQMPPQLPPGTLPR